LKQVRATRYVTPLREGGSLPGIVEADDLGTYVCKFRGAGQGLPVLVAEVVVSELALRLGLRTPRLVELVLEPAIARYEADEEVQDLLTASVGLNLGVDFLPGSFGYDGSRPPSPEEAARILWLDAFTANVDRTWGNPNLLVWHGRTWAIDHGAALYFQHQWDDYMARSTSPFAPIKDHVLLPFASALHEADSECHDRLSPDVIDRVVALIPDDWLGDTDTFADAASQRQAYGSFLQARLAASRSFMEEAVRARSLRV
jgi:hypothetical protein